MSRFRPYTSLRGQRAAFNTLQAWLVRCRRWHHGSSAIASFGSASHYSLCQWSSSLPLPSNCKERPGTKIADVSPDATRRVGQPEFLIQLLAEAGSSNR